MMGIGLRESSHSWPYDNSYVISMGDLQDPKMYHFLAIFYGDIHLHRPYIGLIYGRYLQFRILKFPLIIIIQPEKI